MPSCGPSCAACTAASTIHDTFDALLERRDLDAVLIFSDNRTSAELGVRALDRQLPVMIEKPMAADLDGAESMLFAARKRGVPLMVNWPTVWRPALRYGLTLAAEGVVGDPIQVSHRGGHAGPREFGCSPQFSEWLYDPKRNGGGALVDYCGYGALLCRLVLGQPTAVIGGRRCRRASPTSPPRTTRWWCSPTRGRWDCWRPAGRRSAASRPSR